MTDGRYYTKMQADRQARQDRYKAEKAKEDDVRRKEDIERMREEAKAPAFQAEIEDTSVLIGWFKGKYGGGEVPSTNAAKASSTNPLEGVKEHEIRKVDSDFKGMTLKKKGEDEELGGFFGGGGKSKKKGGKKGGAATGSGSQTPLWCRQPPNEPFDCFAIARYPPSLGQGRCPEGHFGPRDQEGLVRGQLCFKDQGK
jgi:hypothetical protein